MLFGKRDPRSVGARRRGVFRPRADALEGRLLLAIDLGGTTPPQLPLIATAPVGVEMVGSNAGGGAGFSVSNVGDMNADGYDDFLVGTPTVGNTGGIIVPASGVPTVYLIFGSRTTTATAIVDWLTSTANQRVGDLSQLGNSPAAQQNPLTGVAGYPFEGISIVTSQTPNSQLGVAVAAAGTINGRRAMLIGAPNHRDVNGANAGAGRAFLIYASAGLPNVSGKQLDLDNPLQNAGISVVTFVNSVIGGSVGRGLAGVGDVITDGSNDIAIGAPTITANGRPNAGAVYLLSGAALPTTTATINLANVGTSTAPGIIFAGANTGDNAGWSISGAGNVNGDITTSGNIAIQDMLIGAPANTSGGAGRAYLVYGSLTLPAQSVGGVIDLGRIGATGTTGVAGATFVGPAAGAQTGRAVSSAGDFNADGLADVLIGSPGASSSAGRVDLFYGQSVSGTPISGTINLASPPTTFSHLIMTGGNAGDMAGFSLSEVGRINTTPGNPIIIGAPGYANNAGTAYLIPSNPGQLEGTQSLASAESQPLAATQFTLTNPVSTLPTFFGYSVSGRLLQSGQNFTADGDRLGDIIIGAPGLTATATGRNTAGGVFILEGAFVPLQVPVSTSIVATIGVEKPFGPFTNIDPTNPATMQIYVFSNATISPAFAPVTQIDPATVVVNGVAFPSATIAADPVDENNDGVPDAIVTITPRSNIGLTSTTTSLTISGRTRTTGVNANRRWTGSANITVAGGGGGGGGTTLGSSVPVGYIPPTQFIPPFGPDRAVPTLSALSRLGSYQPIPYRLAVQQYMPPHEFADRLVRYYYPKSHGRQFGTNSPHDSRGTTTLGSKVFTRGKWHAGDVKEFTHSEHVIPTRLQSERLSGQALGYRGFTRNARKR